MTTHLVGAGGVNFWVGVALARAGVEFTIWDDDTLEGGLGSQRLPKAHNAKTFKVDLLRGFLAMTMGEPAERFTYIREKFSGMKVEKGDVVIDGTDMAPKPRKTMWTRAMNRGAKMMRVSYDGANGTVVVAGGPPLVDKAEGGYAAVPSLALSFMAAGVGALAVLELLNGNETFIEFQITMADLIPGYQNRSAIGGAVVAPVETGRQVAA